MFATARKEALGFVYKNKLPAKTGSLEVAADFEEVAASCGYFSSSLQDFAEDMITYLDILEELKGDVNRSPRKRTWKWLLFWRRWGKWNKRDGSGRRVINPPEFSLAYPHSEQSSLIEESAERGLSHEIPRLMRRVNSIGDPGKPLNSQPYTYRLWRALRFFRRDDTKYAFKVGAGAVAYAVWSFIPATRPLYSHWRGEWGLLSYMLVCSMTIGASNTTGYQRFLGTCIGALCAVIAWIISNDNPFVLCFFGWVVSLGCFYIIVGKGKGPMGRFILLTYNLSALYAYSLSVKDSDDDDDEGGISPEIWEIVLHRVVAVMAGCIWGIVVTRIIWPISARRKMRDGICILWLRMGLIWKRGPLATLLEDTDPPVSYMDQRVELELQRFLMHLETLRSAATSEFELRGPFPDKSFKRILEATGRMLDSFHAMNVVILKDLKASEGEKEILKYTRHEWMQLSWRISHLLSGGWLLMIFFHVSHIKRTMLTVSSSCIFHENGISIE